MPTTDDDRPVQQLTETVSDWRTAGFAIEREQRLVRGVALVGVQSRNGYRYTEEALRQAAALYERKPVFLDHAANVQRPYERSTRDLIGSIARAWYEDGRIRADIQVLDTESGRTFLALVEADAPAVGMSHVVLAERNSDRTVVERIREVVSVDAVAFPATTSTFRENRGGEPARLYPGSLESLAQAIDAQLAEDVPALAGRPDVEVRHVAVFGDELLVELSPAARGAEEPSIDDGHSACYRLGWRLENGQVELGGELTPVDSQELSAEGFTPRLVFVPASAEQIEAAGLVETLLRERDDWEFERGSLRKQIAQFEQDRREREQQAAIEQLLEQSALPRDAWSDTFLEQLRDADSTDERHALVEDRRTLCQRLTRLPPRSRGRAATFADRLSDDAVVSAIRGERVRVARG